MKNEFLEFLKTNEQVVPVSISENILSKIALDLKPLSLKIVLSKFFALQFSVGVLTLLVCPQFGIGPIGGGHGLSHYFMQIGTWACAIFCGSVYFGLSYFLSLLILQRKEIFLLYQKRLSIIPLVGIAFTALLMMGQATSPADDMYFQKEFLTIWLLVGLVLSQVTLEFARSLKVRMQ